MTDDTGHYVLGHCSSYLFLHVLLYVPRTCSMLYAGVKTGVIEYQPDFGRISTPILFIAHYSSLDGIEVLGITDYIDISKLKQTRRLKIIA